jgi:hypothetical protein
VLNSGIDPKQTLTNQAIVAKSLGYLSIAAVVTFLSTIEFLTGSDSFDESFLGKAAIVFTVLGITVPWVYAIERFRDAGLKKRMLICFACTPFAASYFLFRLESSMSIEGDNRRNAHQ